jgi:hypothetical protein
MAKARFILSVAAIRGPDHTTVARSRTLDPIAAETALALLDGAPRGAPALASLLGPLWDLLG